jgi:hypothetical protein
VAGKNRSYGRKAYPSATLSTTNPTWTSLRLNPGPPPDPRHDPHQALLFDAFLSYDFKLSYDNVNDSYLPTQKLDATHYRPPTDTGGCFRYPVQEDTQTKHLEAQCNLDYPVCGLSARNGKLLMTNEENGK